MRNSSDTRVTIVAEHSNGYFFFFCNMHHFFSAFIWPVIKSEIDSFLFLLFWCISFYNFYSCKMQPFK